MTDLSARTPPQDTTGPDIAAARARALVGGIVAALGIWLMAAPAVIGYGEPLATSDRIFGPVIATFAVVAWWEATRSVGKWNAPLGLWVLVAPWVLGADGTWAVVNGMAAGALVMALSLVKGKVEKTYGGGWSSLWSDDPEHERIARERS